MAVTTSRGYKKYSLPTDDNVIFEQYLNDTSNSNVELMNTDLNGLESAVDKKIILNGEVGKSNFNFIENKVVQDGLIGYGELITEGNQNTYQVETSVLNVQFKLMLNNFVNCYPLLLNGVNGSGGVCLFVNSSNGWISLNNPSSSGTPYNFPLMQLKTGVLYTINISRVNERISVMIDSNSFNYVIPQDISSTRSIFIGRSVSGSMVRITSYALYNRTLSPQEIQHNFSVLNNSPSINQLQVTNPTDQTLPKLYKESRASRGTLIEIPYNEPRDLKNYIYQFI